MNEIWWHVKIARVLDDARQVFIDGNKTPKISKKNLYPLLRQVGEEIDDTLRGGWDDDIPEGDLPSAFFGWLKAGFELEDYSEWSPAQLMAAYAVYLAVDAEKRWDEAAPASGELRQYNEWGWARDETIEHCAANIIAAREACHFGLLFTLGNTVQADPERLDKLVQSHLSALARKRAGKMHAEHTEPKKAIVREWWRKWSSDPSLYKNKAAFDEALADKTGKKIRTIEKWRLELQKQDIHSASKVP